MPEDDDETEVEEDLDAEGPSDVLTLVIEAFILEVLLLALILGSLLARWFRSRSAQR